MQTKVQELHKTGFEVSFPTTSCKKENLKYVPLYYAIKGQIDTPKDISLGDF